MFLISFLKFTKVQLNVSYTRKTFIPKSTNPLNENKIDVLVVSQFPLKEEYFLLGLPVVPESF